MNYKIEKLDNEGRGICFVDGKITFVENAIEDEIISIDIVKEKKKFNEARVSEYIKKSDRRVDAICPYYEKCGGCNLMHITYDDQVKFKKKKTLDVLSKFGDVKFDDIKLNQTKQFNYRNKITLKVNGSVGYYNKESYDIVDVENCYIADNKINEILKEIRNLDLKNVFEIVIRKSENTNDLMVVFKSNGKLVFDYNKIDATSIIWFHDNIYETLKGKDYIIEKLGDLEFVISPDSFFQVNTSGALKLYNKVLEFSKLNKNDNVLDLYCGTGTIGIYLSRYCNSVIGVELNKYAVDDAIKNKKLNRIDNIDFICDDAANVKFKDIDLVVVDPPRSGLSREMIYYLLGLNVNRIVYVSCDPVTLSRDLKILKEKYNIENIELVDMFPNTYHCESVVILERK